LLRPDAGLGKKRCDAVRHVEVEQVGNRQVHGDVQVETGCIPGRALPNRGGQDIAAQRLDQSRALGDGNEVARRDESALPVLPAHKGLHPDDPPALELGLGLEVNEKIFGIDRAAQLAGERKAHCVVRVLLGVVDRRSRVRVLGHVHRHVGVLEDDVSVGAVLGVSRHPHTRSNFERQVAKVKGNLEGRVEALRKLSRVRG